MSGEGADALAHLGAHAVPRLSGIDLTRRADAGLEGIQPTALAPSEPHFDTALTADIQGNVLPGFNKDHQRFLFFDIDFDIDGDIDACSDATDDLADARAWLRTLAPRLSSMAEVLEFRRAFRRERLRSGATAPSVTATWVAFAISGAGVHKLLGARDLEAMGDHAFRQGMSERSAYLGDPDDPAVRGHRNGWRTGGDGEADFLVIVASDTAADADREAAEIIDDAGRHGVRLSFAQAGETLPGSLSGHEHFGFKDGISQPGVRGTTDDGEFLTPRYLDARSPHAGLFGKPGQPLVWPGEFVLGLPRQHPSDPLAAGGVSTAFPEWAVHGSYLVFRRLAQDVPVFWDFAARTASEVGTTPEHLASLLVGRWPSGAPLSRNAQREDPALAGDEFAANHFLFDDDTRGWVPSADLSTGGYAGDRHPPARSDIAGVVCPIASHVRKVNPRDAGTDFGAPADTLLRLMLRRGIPYGRPIAGVPDPSAELVAEERGLVFAAYMASIEDQFEFVTRRWANSPHQPNPGGHDPVIGQSNVHGDRTRTFEITAADGERTSLRLDREWVTPTGGGYYFAPTISSVTVHLAPE